MLVKKLNKEQVKKEKKELIREVNGIHFTDREIDIIACVLNGRTPKKIASVLSISPKTVANHITNIMFKIGCNSREGLIDFIEKSEKAKYLKQYYTEIMLGYENLSIDATDSIDSISDTINAETVLSPISLSLSSSSSLLPKIIKFNEIKIIHRKKYWIGFLILLILLSHGFYLLCFSPKVSDNSAIQKLKPFRSALPVPAKGTLLERPELLKQMQEKLNKQQGIQTVSLAGLVGMGGVGKTTLARLYGRSSESTVVYEINAETKGTLSSSFYDLAKALARNGTKENQDALSEVNDLKNAEEREREILVFVQSRLKERNGWLLIYDNVEENFTNFQEYFPKDSNIWGTGQVIVTTRNKNLKNLFTDGENIVPIDRLTEEDALTLFKTIYYGNHYGSNSNNRESVADSINIEKLLKNIPPFPLDVSLAASYLAITQASFDSYIEKLKSYNPDFEILQQKVLKDKGDYDKTRTSVVQLSLEQLLNEHQDFKVLLLMISLLDSQSIPREVFDKCINNTTVDKFIYHLQKYSLVALNKVKEINDLPVLTIHRSTQEISLKYLTQVLKLNKNSPLFSSITNVLEKYMMESLDEENIEKTKLLVNHLETFKSHTLLLSDNTTTILNGILGCGYYFLEEDNKAQNLLESSLSALKKTPEKERHRIAKFSVSLGDLYRGIHYDKSRMLLEESLDTFRKYFPNEQMEIALALEYLARINIEFSRFKDAKEQLMEALEIYQKHTADDHCKIAGALRRLGELFIITEDVKNALQFTTQALNMYKKDCAKERHNIAKVSVYLGSLYEDLGDYPQSKHFLETGKILFKEIYDEKVVWNRIPLIRVHRKLGDYKKAVEILNEIPEHHLSHIWMKLCRAGLARDLGDLELSKELYEQGLKFYLEKVSPNTLYVAWTKIELGRTYVLLKRFDEAKKLMEEGASIYRRLNYADNHPRYAWIYWCLADVEMHMGNYTKAKELLDKSLDIYEKNSIGKEIKIARVFRGFGWLYALQSDKILAESYFRKSLKIFEAHNHPDKSLCFQDLGDLYLNCGEKAQALKFYNKALSLDKKYLPKGSTRIRLLQDKIEGIQI